MAVLKKGKRRRDLTDQQIMFAEYYVTTANFNAAEAARQAGYSDSDISNRAYKMLQNPQIIEIIQEKLERKKAVAFYSEEDILRKMYEEATNYSEGASHASRINALVWLGKHIGMWNDKLKEKELAVQNQGGPASITIINYSTGESPKENLKEKIINEVHEHEEEVQQAQKAFPQEIEIADYSEDKS